MSNHSLDSRQSLAVELLLVFANKAEADIIFQDEWNENVREHACFHCYHVEQPPAGWSQGTGRITDAILRAQLPPPGPDTVIFLCGSPPIADALEPLSKRSATPSTPSSFRNHLSRHHPPGKV